VIRVNSFVKRNIIFNEERIFELIFEKYLT